MSQRQRADSAISAAVPDPVIGQTWERRTATRTCFGQVLDVHQGRVLLLMRATSKHRVVAMRDFKLNWQRTENPL